MKIGRTLLLCAVWIACVEGAHAQGFEVAESTILEEQRAMTEGRVTAKALVQAYLDRIEAFDRRGPHLNAVITLNPNALREAEGLDRERA
ncbi:MAG: amidase, partial [Candidatus Solibacter sp.]|nr:amidase [Candidatus Solibacter sp.]